MKISIASDHAGFTLKEELKKLLPEIHWEDLGPKNDQSVDYPDFALRVAEKVSSGESPFGVLICGSGIGMSIAANKVKGVRAAAVSNATEARLAREHNSANVLCLGGRFLAPTYAAEITREWLKAAPSPEPRHQKRIEKIHDIEKKN